MSATSSRPWTKPGWLTSKNGAESTSSRTALACLSEISPATCGSHPGLKMNGMGWGWCAGADWWLETGLGRWVKETTEFRGGEWGCTAGNDMFILGGTSSPPLYGLLWVSIGLGVGALISDVFVYITYTHPCTTVYIYIYPWNIPVVILVLATGPFREDCETNQQVDSGLTRFRMTIRLAAEDG